MLSNEELRVLKRIHYMAKSVPTIFGDEDISALAKLIAKQERARVGSRMRPKRP